MEKILNKAIEYSNQIEVDLQQIQTDMTNSEKINPEWNTFNADIVKQKLTEQKDKAIAKKENKLLRMSADIISEMDDIRLNTLDTLQPLLNSKESDKERSGQFWLDTAFKFTSMASIPEIEAEYKNALLDNRFDYCTGLLKWSAVKFKKPNEQRQINTVKKEYSKHLGLDKLVKAIKILELSLERVQNFSPIGIGGKPNLTNLIREKRLPQMKQDILSGDIPVTW